MTTTATKWVYLFAEGSADMRTLLGGKGAGVAEMTKAQLPVPPGFTITTEACNAFYTSAKQFPAGMWDQALIALKHIEEQTGKKFGDTQNPLLVSVRSGAAQSMPGMMDTVLNLGLNDESIKGLIAQTQNDRFAYDAYRRFISMYGKIVLDLDPGLFEKELDAKKKATGAAADTDLNVDALKELVVTFKGIIQRETGSPFPTDPLQQLDLAIKAVFSSWMSKRAIDYREFYKIPHDMGTAVTVQTMVFGNMGDDSGTGVAFTRNPLTGERVLYGEYLTNAQGEDVVAGIRTPKPIASLKQELPEIYNALASNAELLEKHYHDMQDLEFTVEHGKLFMLQTRSGKRSPSASVRMAVEMVHDGLIDKNEAIRRVEPLQIELLLHRQIDPDAKVTVIAKGLNASPGAAVGKVVFNADRAEELAKKGEKLILVRPETNPDDVHGIIAALGVLTARGGATSHAAVVARGLGKPCVAGCEAITVDAEHNHFTVDDGGRVVREGDIITINGTTGEVILGEAPLIEATLSGDLQELLGWADDVRRLRIFANADYPRDAQKAREYGAEGVGLCRTEHMFFEPERLAVIRGAIVAAGDANIIPLSMEDPTSAYARPATAAQQGDNQAHHVYMENIAKLEAFQTSDFTGLFRVMEGLPVVIRLLDPPLHEFLPRYDELLTEVVELRMKGESKEREEKEKLFETVSKMREANPMLGLRGCRLGIMFPEMFDMQVRAIINGAISVKKEGIDALAEIMIPLTGAVNEMTMLTDRLKAIAEETEKAAGVNVHYKFGTMIELPRAALISGDIAKTAEFFSFGTNDLTQTVYGISRDDAEGKFLLHYVDAKILPDNPFQVLDPEGVGRLMRISAKEGRETRPDLELGICGEHGGDPASIALCDDIGLNYVSCSPFRVPVARLAAAQAALAHGSAKVAAHTA